MFNDLRTLRASGVAGPIYTADEIKKIKGLPSENLQIIEEIKEVFENAIVEEVQRPDCTSVGGVLK